MLRAIRRIGDDPLAFLATQWRTHGDVVQFPIPSPPTYMVSHPDDVRMVLVGRSRDVTKNTIQYRALSRVTGQGLLTSDNPVWREHRRILQPAFHPDTLPGVAAHPARAASGLVTRLRERGDGGVVDIDAEVMTLALEVVGDSLFGHELAGGRPPGRGHPDGPGRGRCDGQHAAAGPVLAIPHARQPADGSDPCRSLRPPSRRSSPSAPPRARANRPTCSICSRHPAWTALRCATRS